MSHTYSIGLKPEDFADHCMFLKSSFKLFLYELQNTVERRTGGSRTSSLFFVKQTFQKGKRSMHSRHYAAQIKWRRWPVVMMRTCERLRGNQ
ncbi:hypothetical protein TNCV_3457321 [Trichonephila clavipes]|nr:hypothetical protein TNCV_3457321 [Trichonephila clavipes]